MTYNLNGETIIFLDFDGPLLPARFHFIPPNNEILMEDYTGEYQDSHEKKLKIKFDPVAIHALNRWTEVSDAKIVLSTHWSKYATKEQLIEYLKNNGFLYTDRIHEHWTTTKHKLWNRGDEISYWLSSHRGEIKNYLIFEDDFSVLNHPHIDPKKVILANFHNGISWEQIFEGFEIFGVTDYK